MILKVSSDYLLDIKADFINDVKNKEEMKKQEGQITSKETTP